MPNPILSPRKWFEFVDKDNSGTLSYGELCSGLKSQILLDWSQIESDQERFLI